VKEGGGRKKLFFSLSLFLLLLSSSATRAAPLAQAGLLIPLSPESDELPLLKRRRQHLFFDENVEKSV